MAIKEVLLIIIFLLIGGSSGMLTMRLVEAGTERLFYLLEKKVKVRFNVLKDFHDENLAIETEIKSIQERNDILKQKLKAFEQKLIQQYQEV